jgi:hypothetical protein
VSKCYCNLAELLGTQIPKTISSMRICANVARDNGVAATFRAYLNFTFHRIGGGGSSLVQKAGRHGIRHLRGTELA